MTHPTRPRRHRRFESLHCKPSAFTLVELLVVIGIIALLISILLPALNRSRRSAQTAACLSNLRQIGIAYRLYAESNRGLMPYVLNRSWDSTIGPKTDNNRLYWFRALAQFMGRSGMDPLSIDAKQLPKIFSACPAWLNWMDGAEAANEWRPGYGQNLYMFVGNYFPRKVPQGTRRVRNDWSWGGGPNVGIDSQQEAKANDWSVDTGCIGQIKLASIPRPAARIIAGDAVQYWMGLGGNGQPFSFPDLPKDMGFDFGRGVNDIPPGTAADQTAFAAVGWTGGHPNRHGGEIKDCRADAKGSRATAAKANYLFADGHAVTLSYIEARRQLQAPTQ